MKVSRRSATLLLPLVATLATLGALEVGARLWSDPTGGNAALVAQRAAVVAAGSPRQQRASASSR